MQREHEEPVETAATSIYLSYARHRYRSVCHCYPSIGEPGRCLAASHIHAETDAARVRASCIIAAIAGPCAYLAARHGPFINDMRDTGPRTCFLQGPIADATAESESDEAFRRSVRSLLTLSNGVSSYRPT